KDEGIGIPEKELSSLFEPFYRASNTGNIPGSGLGLAIVKRFVELHNGKINIQSKVGEGTEFTITIPLIKVT
ncbi:MAG: ATP-binding protein, partial [Ignavibacteria bacterium]